MLHARRRCRTSIRTGLSECLGLDHGHDPRRSRPMSAAASATRASCCPRKSASAGWRCAAAIRCAGSRTAASSSPPTPIAASTTTTSPAMPTATAGCSASTARRPSIPAPIRPIRSRRASKPRRSRASCPAPTISTPIAAAPGRSPPTRPDPALSRRGAHRRVLRARTGARRDRARSGHGAVRGAAAGIWCGRSRCRSTTSPRSISTAATIRKRCAARWRIRRAGGARAPGASGEPDGRLHRRRAFGLLRAGARTAPRSMPAGASRWCRATSRPPRGSRPTAGSNCASACIRTARAWRRRWRRSPTRCSASTPSKVKVMHGDTAMTPYSTGTWGSRCMVMAGGAVASACREIGKPRQADRRASAAGRRPKTSDSSTARCVVGRPAMSACRRSRTPGICARRTCRPTSIRGGLEATVGYKPERDTGTFSYAAHAVVVAVDPELGDVEILDYVIVEDGGKLVNPMVVDGQIYGGIAQGIGTALYEEMPFDSNGQPLASTFADYLLPGPTEVPGAAPRSHGDAVALYRVRPEGHRRGRRHRAAGGDRQRRQRCAARDSASRCCVADHAAAGA